ncbi:hypothetical protein DCS_05583 [Drechmeria coniospora]|uniref:Histidine kinase group protein n=1 Tax=Drechmeria coniospora TaxID=98403 RepID=A0A151GN93_DRECN|nr:hypothetical protein DCS_05583 [Drechmeria coniospora]KYK58566.1 hypothetical protein DCS_05583 [Drechmeria coniospora]
MAKSRGRKSAAASHELAIETEDKGQSPSPSPSPLSPPPSAVQQGQSVQAGTKGSKARKNASSSSLSPSASSLIICRNKHWRHISSFHGHWLQMPVETLETIANINYNTPRPRPIDPAVLFDVIKIRRNVDEASDLAVRAASDMISPILSSVGGIGAGSMSSFGLGPAGHGAKLSRERRFRMRELASQKLARAYRLDEIASSVATMQGASTLEEIGGLVLQRNPNDLDAKYVHFFHEKIPSRQLAESTDLKDLEGILSQKRQPEVLRTSASVKIFKDDLDGALQDLTAAMNLSRYNSQLHQTSTDPLPEARQLQAGKRRPVDVILAEDEQPSGLDSQLLLQRACVYLAMACDHVPGGLSNSSTAREHPEPEGAAAAAAEQADADSDNTEENSKDQAEVRRIVKSMAKRALRDLMAFLSAFEYSPDLPIKIHRDFYDRVEHAKQGTRNPRNPDANSPIKPHTVHPISVLFSPQQPPDLPEFPYKTVEKNGVKAGLHDNTCEWVTYHPLLTEALHCLLLCHCLAQTSPKELQRHAYMVARLVRLCDGHPVFQASRSPARSDWVEVLRRTDQWLDLCAGWDSLCFPAPLPILGGAPRMPLSAHKQVGASAAADSVVASQIQSEGNKEMGTMGKAILGAACVASKGLTREVIPLGTFSGVKVPSSAIPLDKDSPLFRDGDDSKDGSLASDRSLCISQWVKEAPTVTATKPKRKKRVRRDNGLGEMDKAAEDLGKLEL